MHAPSIASVLRSAAVSILFIAPGPALGQMTAGAAEQQLPTVTVTATRTERPVEDAPATVTVIDAERIEKEVMKGHHRSRAL